MEDNDRTRNDEGPNWGTKDQSERDNRTESDMEIEQSEPSDQNSPADHELGPKQPNRGRNPSGYSYRHDRRGDGDGGYQGRFDRWKVICRLLIPSKAAGSVIGKSGSTIKGLREQYGCSVMIPALERGGPERIITIKAANYNLIGKIVARCSEHLDEFLRRNIPIRLLLPSFGIQNLPPMPVQYCKSNFNSSIHIFPINCPHSNERVITIAGNSEAKGKTVACLLERSDETLKEFADDLNDYDPNKFSDSLDYGGFNQYGQMRDHQKDHKQPMRLHQGSSREKDDQIENFMEEKITIQNNQHFGQDQLWLKKFSLHKKYFKYIVGKGGTIMEEIRKFSGARIKYGAAQRDHRLIAISGNNKQIDTAIFMMQKVIHYHNENINDDEFKSD